MNETLDLVRVGQRVRVVDGGVPQYGQLGTVVARSSTTSWYVRLDDGEDEPMFFQFEELELVAAEDNASSSNGVARLSLAA